MALSKLSGDEQGIIFVKLCNALDPRVAMGFSTASSELREASTLPLRQQLRDQHEAATALCLKVRMRSCKELREAKHIELWEASTLALRQQLRAQHEAATALCLKMGMRSCKDLRETKYFVWKNKDLSETDLALLGKLGSVLPALESLTLYERYGAPVPDGVQRLAEGLGVGALPAVQELHLSGMQVGDAGASALAAALGRGAMPQLTHLFLSQAALSDAGLAALAPALRRRPALEHLHLWGNPFGDEGLAALVAPPQPAGAPPAAAGVLAKLKMLDLSDNQITDAGCAALAAVLNNGALPALERLYLLGIPASPVAKAAVRFEGWRMSVKVEG